jgi:hypothetical protein
MEKQSAAARGEVKPLTRQQIESMLNDCKYDLMALNQNLSIVGSASKLAEELISKRESLQQKIDKLEADLKRLSTSRAVDPAAKDVKKIVKDDGRVKIWASSSS